MLVVQELRGPGEMALAPEADGVVVFFFHGPEHCTTCDRLEAAWREAVEGGFADELRSGRLRMASVDFLAPESKP